MFKNSRIYSLLNQIEISKNSIVSENIISSKFAVNNLYSLDENENIDKEKLFEETLYYILSGKISVQNEDENFELYSNDCLIIPKNQWRSLYAVEPSKFLLMSLKEDFMIDYLNKREVFKLIDSIDYQDNKIVSKTVVKNDLGSMTLLSLKDNQELSTHAAPGDALVIALDGEAYVEIEGTGFTIKKNESIIFPAHVPHSVKVIDKFKMLLIVSKEEEE